MRDCNIVKDKINKTANHLGFNNGKHWVEIAQKNRAITYSKVTDFLNAIDLRNNIAHGKARDIDVSLETMRIAEDFLFEIEHTRLKAKDEDLNSNQVTDKHGQKTSKDGGRIAEKKVFLKNNFEELVATIYNMSENDIKFKSDYKFILGKQKTLLAQLNNCSKNSDLKNIIYSLNSMLNAYLEGYYRNFCFLIHINTLQIYVDYNPITDFDGYYLKIGKKWTIFS